MNKAELLNALEEGREAFLETLEGLDEEALQTPGVVGTWSLKDLLAHLSRWEAELVKLLWQARQGQKPTSAQLTATNVDEINALWQAETRARELERVLEDFHTVRNQTLLRVEEFTDQELTDPRRYKWLKGQPLWQMIAENSFAHEAEHAEQINAWRAQK
jgi:hypothetical protein